jgi:hypothetical protein
VPTPSRARPKPTEVQSTAQAITTMPISELFDNSLVHDTVVG